MSVLDAGEAPRQSRLRYGCREPDPRSDPADRQAPTAARALLRRAGAESALSLRDGAAGLGPELAQTLLKLQLIFGFTFPNRDHRPALIFKLFLLERVSVFRGIAFLGPEFGIGGWHDRAIATRVRMPETPVDEDHQSPRSENDVWLPWQIRNMEVVAIAVAMQPSPDDQFRRRVLRLDT